MPCVIDIIALAKHLKRDALFTFFAQSLWEREGVTELLEAVTRGAHERLSPILMTAMASGLGLLPLVLAGGEPGSEIETPMAIVIVCGLSTATVLNMIIVPALYLRFGSLRGAGSR